MCVDPSQRGAGVGQRLLQAALAIAKGQTQTQTQELELTVMTHLKAAMSMYEKAGFVKVGGEVHNGGEVYLQRMSLGL
jgi:ribosomal protein S18 acetylase RimI-like enzyme